MRAIRKVIAVLLLILLVLPVLQQLTGFPKVRGLKGYFENPVKPSFSVSNFLNGTYQDSLNTWLEHHVGFRPDLIRIYNQLRYSLFDTVTANAVVRGKNGFLYETNYIRALYGLDYVGDEQVEKHATQLSQISEWLGRHNKHLVVLLAPGKASFFPEHVPDRFASAAVGKRNDFEYAKALSARGVPVIHGNPWFAAMRDTAKLALFPKCGIHWSYYGMTLAFDSLINTMAQVSGRKWLDFRVSRIEVTHKLRSPDRDLWEGLNIICEPDDFAMPYPELQLKKIGKAPNVMVVADSYYWQWFGSGYATEAFGEHAFWYYNEQIFPGDGGSPIERRNVDMLLRVLENDFIVILLTDANMYRFGFGFVEQLHEAIQQYDSLSASDLAKLDEIVAAIRASEEWMANVRQKAADRRISEEEMIRLDAFWVLQHNKTKN
ncbi:MAG: hypothetical protein IPM52_07385 [Bacteroidetes bacterium]|nr:hypothetical protein [Bacteroidota bacterium]